MNQNRPYKIFRELALSFLHINDFLVEISIVCKFHHQAKWRGSIFKKWVFVCDYIRV